MGLGALLDRSCEGAAHSADDAAVFVSAVRAHRSKLSSTAAAQQEHGQEVGQALRAVPGAWEHVTDLLTMLLAARWLSLELRTVRAL